jgi:hypothetical protein
LPLFVVYRFFFCQKMPIIRLFVYPIKGAHGGTHRLLKLISYK